MSMRLMIEKVNVLPIILTPTTIYFLRDINDRLSIHLTDNSGNITYSSYDKTAISAISQEVINNLINQPNGLAGLDANGNLIGGILSSLDGQEGDIRHSNDYVWEDLMEIISYRNTSGGNNPTWGTLWNNHQGLIFSGTTMNQAFATYHFHHDIALNTGVYLHVHFLPLDNTAGTVRFGFEYPIAKGHGQESFPATDGIIFTELAIPSNSYRKNYVAEIPEPGIISSSIEPDANMKVRIYRDANNDSYNGDIHLWQADIHYQRGRLGTKNRAPNFFI